MTITEYTSRLLPPTFSMAFSPSEGPVRKFSSSVVPCLLVAAVLFPLAGCIAHAPGSGGGQQILVTVTSTPTSPASVSVSTASTPSTVQYTATVSGTSNQAVTWSLAAYSNVTTVCTASGTGLGTIVVTGSNTMTYTAPQTVPVSPCGIVVTATSNQDNVTTGQAILNVHSLQLVITVTSSPASPASIPASTSSTPSTVQYTATVTGTTNQAVTWSLAAYSNASTLCTATGAGLGTFVKTGNNSMTYTAPQTVPVSPCGIAVTATSNEDNVSTGQALVNVHVFVTVSPLTDTIGQGANLQYTGTVNGAPAGSQGIVWSASCPTCQNGQTGGAFDPSNPGLFIAPGLQQGVTTVTTTITAASNLDPNQFATGTMTVQESDPLGTVTTTGNGTISCPTFGGGLTGATCYQVNVSCDGIAPYSVYLKVNAPTGTPLGTVIFGTGTGGSTLYDYDSSFIVGAFNGGLNVVQGVLNPTVANAGYTTVQVSFGSPFNSTGTDNGWLQGPGGVRRLACRYATVADWIYKNIHNSKASAPMCGTGNSGGSGAIGYALTEYKLASEFAMVELTSGPVMTRLHQGCNVCGQYTGSDPCTQLQENMCYTVSSGGSDSSAGIIDSAYQAQGQTTPTLCTDGINGINTNFNRFLSDSIEDDPANSVPLPIPNPPTNVNVVFGTDDTSNAVPQGYAWWGGVGPQPPAPTCVPVTPHAVPSTSAGAAQIVTDIQKMCIVH